MSKEERQSHWDDVASHFTPVRGAYSTGIYRDGEWRLFKIFFKDLVGKKLLKLDLWNETFNTTILDKAADAGTEIHAIDISPEIVKRAIQNFNSYNNRKPFFFKVGDIRKIPYPDNTFDYLYTMGTIEHVPDPETSIKEIERVLKPGGRAIIGVPYRFDFFGRAAIVWLGNKTGFLPYGEEKCFSWRQFKKLFEGTNFKFISRSGAYFMPWFLRFPDMYLYQRLPILTYLLRPFLWICKYLGNFDFLLRYNSLVAFIVEKPKEV